MLHCSRNSSIMLKNLSIMLKIMITIAVNCHDKKVIINVAIQCTIIAFCCNVAIRYLSLIALVSEVFWNESNEF